jgi:hypothetical protein
LGFRTLSICIFSLLFRKNPDDGQSPKTQYLCVLYTIAEPYRSHILRRCMFPLAEDYTP